MAASPAGSADLHTAIPTQLTDLVVMGDLKSPHPEDKG
jgi:hypothetical protein